MYIHNGNLSVALHARMSFAISEQGAWLGCRYTIHTVCGFRQGSRARPSTMFRRGYLLFCNLGAQNLCRYLHILLRVYNRMQVNVIKQFRSSSQLCIQTSTRLYNHIGTRTQQPCLWVVSSSGHQPLPCERVCLYGRPGFSLGCIGTSLHRVHVQHVVTQCSNDASEILQQAVTDPSEAHCMEPCLMKIACVHVGCECLAEADFTMRWHRPGHYCYYVLDVSPDNPIRVSSSKPVHALAV